jgi:hypothetical protein
MTPLQEVEVTRPVQGERKPRKAMKFWPKMLTAVAVSACALLPTTAVRAEDGYSLLERILGEDVGGNFSRVQRGFAIAPVPLNLRHKNKRLVGLGSYIVNAQGGCNDCHTNPNFAPGGNPFLGEPEQINTEQYLTGGRVFGPFVSRNLTPDATGKPAGLTREEFRTLLRTGHDPDAPPGTLLQVMPWPVYGKMIDHDLNAIYEYLSAIPSRPNNPNPTP